VSDRASRLTIAPNAVGFGSTAGSSTRSLSEALKTHQPPLQYNSLPFQGRSMIRAMIEATLSRTVTAISTAIPSGRSLFSKNYSIETLWRINE
jgi:hypothetical protein